MSIDSNLGLVFFWVDANGLKNQAADGVVSEDDIKSL